MPTLADLRFGLRLLLRAPLFTLTAIASLAIGIAASAAIFSLADALFLRPLPGIRGAERVVEIGRADENGSGMDNFGYPLFTELRDRSNSFESMAAAVFGADPVSLGDGSSSERVYGQTVSASYFDVLGTRAALGRTFLPEEDRVVGERPVVVLSHAFWARRFASDPSIVGRTVQLNGLAFTVVGVAEPGFSGHTLVAPDLWVPISMVAQLRGTRGSAAALLTSHLAVWHTAVGRLKTGVSPAQARDELNAIYAAVAQANPDAYRERRWRMAVAPSAFIPSMVRTPAMAFVGLLLALTLVVMLIACSNVAGMLLARATARRREMATRLAIGADRRRVIVQLLTETTLLFVIAAFAGAVLAFWMVQALESVAPALPVPIALDLRVDLRVVMFAMAVALGTGLLFGLAPARQALRVDIAQALHGHGATADRRRFGLRQALVVSQVALSLLLLVTTGLFLRALQAAGNVDPGFNASNVEVFTMDTSLAAYEGPQTARYADTLVERITAVPGVEAVAISRMVPLMGGGLGLGGLRAPGTTSPRGDEQWDADWDVVSPTYFATLGVPIVQGRGFTPADREGQPFVAVVNETFARRVWGDRSPIGQRLWQSTSRDRADDRPLEIVGVARDAKYRSIGDGPRNFIYVPLAQQPLTELNVYVRRSGPLTISEEVRTILRSADPRLPILLHTTLEEAIGIGLLPQRVAAGVSGGVGLVGLLLAALGLYGLTSYTVAQRTREIAVRMALGASSAGVLKMVLRGAANLAAVGTAVGLVLAAALGTVIQTQLVGVAPFDVTAFLGGAAVLAFVLLVASWIPARKAAALQPSNALRAE